MDEIINYVKNDLNTKYQQLGHEKFQMLYETFKTTKPLEYGNEEAISYMEDILKKKLNSENNNISEQFNHGS
jgi:hypothetical protein